MEVTAGEGGLKSTVSVLGMKFAPMAQGVMETRIMILPKKKKNYMEDMEVKGDLIGHPWCSELASLSMTRCDRKSDWRA